MASATHRVTTPSTSNASSYASGSFTPSLGDLLVVCVTASGTVAAGTVSNSAGTTFTKITSALKASGADTLYLFVADSLVTSATSQTCTFDCTGDNATGAIVTVLSLSGMTRTGAAAVKKSGKQDNGAAAGTPTVSLGSAALSQNLLVGFIGNGSSPATLTQPSSWSELWDSTGYSTPTTGHEVASIASGFTGSSVTWGSTSATAFGAIVAEFDVSAVKTYASSGGGQSGGAAAVSEGKDFDASGGVQSGGGAVLAKVKACLALGGALLSGAALASYTAGATSVTYTYSATGGAASGGTAVLAKAKACMAAGGATAGGTALLAKGKSCVAAGGTQAGGSSPAAKGHAWLATGGATALGAAWVTKGKAYLPAGGYQSGGVALTSLQQNGQQTYTCIAVGGAQSSGAAVVALGKSFTAGGGLQSAGAAGTLLQQILAQTYAWSASGGAQSGGAAPLGKDKAYAAQGGAQAGGVAATESGIAGAQVYRWTAAGGIHGGGYARAFYAVFVIPAPRSTGAEVQTSERQEAAVPPRVNQSSAPRASSAASSVRTNRPTGLRKWV